MWWRRGASGGAAQAAAAGAGSQRRCQCGIMQKALTARIPVVAAVAAVGAPSTLAVTLAQRFNMTLIGFLRGASLNVYAGEQRIEWVGG